MTKIRGFRFFVESHDQGGVSEPSLGNWTWFELVILANETDETPRVKDDVALVWSQAPNFGDGAYRWSDTAFDAESAVLRLLEEGNVLAIRLCARFRGWIISAKNGYLAVDISSDTVGRDPLGYKKVVSEINRIDGALDGVNGLMKYEFKPSLPDRLFQAGAISRGDGDPPLRVLSCDNESLLTNFEDGGGMRGIASLLFLEAVMDKAAPGKEPWQVFDIIGGTSTGGLIAIMLGRLRMNVKDCITFYEDAMDKVFKGGRNVWKFIRKGEFYDASILEGCIKDLIRKQLGSDDEKLFDERTDACKVLWTECLSAYGPLRTINCFLSIGTGIPANSTLPKPGVIPSYGVEARFADVATNTEITNILFHGLIDSFAPQAMTPKYFRLNLDEKDPKNPDNYVGVPALDDINQLHPFEERTRTYIRAHEDVISKCAGAMF
ncbi:hypothetical protein SLS57_010192 [Botryosphaeria dothidea]